MDSMSQTDGDNTSTQTKIPSTISSTNGTTDSGNLYSANDVFRLIVQEMILTDKRFTGMARYVTTIKFFWCSSIKTACAGDGFIFFNKEFWDKLVPEQQKTVVAHEIWHLICDHLNRGQGLDPDSYNIAGDHFINLTLQEDGFPINENSDFGGITPCCDPAYRGLSTEEIYARVHEDRKKDPGSHKPQQGTPSKDQIEDLIKEALEGSGDSIEENKEKDENLRQQIANEAMACPPGDGTGAEDRVLRTECIKVYIKKATYEEIFEPWLIDPLSGGKRTYIRPSRRQVAGGLRLKGKFPKRGRKNRLTHLVYALDVSGSITQYQAQQFLRSAKTLKEKLNPKLMTVMLWDTQIKFEKVFREDETLDNIHVQAGGGTCLKPVYKRVQQINPEALVIFTDLCVDIPPKPDWETIWFVPDMDIYEPYLQQVTYGDIYLVPEE
ncbi:HNH endonuclease [Dinoroseobacter phage DS-1410Ws-06]|uniref:Metallopeptidase domain containing protein n=1 Tax=Dinoroseobacter phage DS-1410Ws-06 TaxID=1815983 RepID=A0A191VY88_9CAUD|nr:HNH endonuclease [Dinoroseobacter phage DS-1410Ws-06]ANJ20676.1 metallopeptidase domain containing protein [Dinoroseobacter phage DS-1410Ws-06]